jgi:hypothetical protein
LHFYTFIPNFQQMIEFCDLFDEVILSVISFLFVEEIAEFSLLNKRFHHLANYNLRLGNKSLLSKWKKTHDNLISQGAFLEKPSDEFFGELLLPDEGLLIQKTDSFDPLSRKETHYVNFYSSFDACLSFKLCFEETPLHMNYHFCPLNKLLIYHFGEGPVNQEFKHSFDVVFDLYDLSNITMNINPIVQNVVPSKKYDGRCLKCASVLLNKNEYELLPLEEHWIIYNHYLGTIPTYGFELINDDKMIRVVYNGEGVLRENGLVVRNLSITGENYLVVDSNHLYVGGSNVSYIINVVTDEKYEFPILDCFSRFQSAGPFLLLRQKMKWSVVNKTDTGFHISPPFPKKSWMIAFCPIEKRLLHFCLIPNESC